MIDRDTFTLTLTARELARLEVACEAKIAAYAGMVVQLEVTDPTDPALAADLAAADEALNNWRALLAKLEAAPCR